MKKYLLTLGLGLFVAISAMAQAKKPTLMVVPSDLWCNQNGYMMDFDNQGIPVKIPNYKMAFQENADLLNVISKINGLMADRGFPLKNLETVLKSLAQESAEDALLMSKSGAEVNESPIDKLKKTAKADIIIQLTWQVNTVGPKNAITFNMQGLDSYTNKQIATAQGTGAPSFNAILPVLLEEAVLAHMDNFTSSLQGHFDDMFENGREITLRIKTWDSWEYDLEDEWDKEELGYLIEDWIAENTMNGRFSTSDATESFMLFEQVRIPLYNDRGRAIDARGYARGLSKWLRDDFEIINKVLTKGQGEVVLILGEK